MKKRGLLIALSAMMLASCGDESREKQLYYQTIEKMKFKVEEGSFGYRSIPDGCWRADGTYPESLEEMRAIFERDIPEEIAIRDEWHFIDIFSKTGDWIGYYPIWDDSDSVILSYILVSAGIDGKMDHIPAPGVRLHMDDWMDSFEFYNPNECEGLVRIDTVPPQYRKLYAKGEGVIREIPPYNPRDARRGKKDLLVHIHHMGHDARRMP